MPGWTDAEEAKILDWYFRGQVATPPTSVFVALATSQPDDTSPTFNECSYTGYARQEVAAAEWNAAVGGTPSVISNSLQVTFPTCPSNTGQTATHFALMAASGTGGTGTRLFSGEITQPPGGLALNSGVQPQFDAGALRSQLGG